MVFVARFDKIETVLRKRITTASEQPYTRFYNYYLMDWYIDCFKPGMIFNEEKGYFEYQKKNDLMAIKSIEDRRVKDEIDEIKANVLKKDRHLFLK